MKQFDIASTREIEGNTFLIRPLPAFKAANMSGELAALVLPLLGSIAPMFTGKSVSSDKIADTFMDIDATEAAPLLANGAASLSGEKVERLLHKLLTQYGNISVEQPDKKSTEVLTDDLANEIFCGNAQDMFILAFDVIKVNFAGFFKNAGSLFGDVLSGIMRKNPILENTES
ncbi:MAG: hypothetical protein LBS21_01510 [Clostridiales bacterium]|jgi:hypothetical protein|nr:hypothetical protein [Clostridiales bacterium]